MAKHRKDDRMVLDTILTVILCLIGIGICVVIATRF